MIFIFDNGEISISIIAKNEKEANRILKENVKDASLYTKEQGIDLEELEID